jgi:hypothetical protein
MDGRVKPGHDEVMDAGASRRMTIYFKCFAKNSLARPRAMSALALS